MERAEDIALFEKPTARNPLHRNELAAPVAELEEPKAVPTRSRYVLASLVLQVALLGIVAGGGVLVGKRLLAVESASRTVAANEQEASVRLAALSEQTNVLGQKAQALETEVLTLRKQIASGTSEDVLYLKVMLLKSDIDPALARTIATNVHHYAMLYEKDPNLVLALISVESNFEPRAVSNVGAVGLMQVMPHWKKVLGIQGELTDPEVNIRYGLQVLGFYDEMYKDPLMALTAYNRGPGPVDMALMRGVNPNNGYAPRVLATYEKLKRLNINTGK